MASTNKKWLITGGDGDWYIIEPVAGTSPEQAVESFERGDGDGLSVGNRYSVYEVVGDPVNFTTEPALKRV